MSNRKRPSLLPCPSCGAAKLRTAKSISRDGCRRRLRVCACGSRHWTEERIVTDADQGHGAPATLELLRAVVGARELLADAENTLRRSSGR